MGLKLYGYARVLTKILFSFLPFFPVVSEATISMAVTAVLPYLPGQEAPCVPSIVAAENAETATVTAEAERLQDVTAEEEQLQAALITAKSSRGGMAELTELEEAIDAAVEAGLTVG